MMNSKRSLPGNGRDSRIGTKILQTRAVKKKTQMNAVKANPEDFTVAATKYTRGMIRSLQFSIVAALFLYAVQWILAWATASALSGKSLLTIPIPEIEVKAAVTAITLLLTTAIAIQVFLRVPRDSERFSTDDAIAHRQFWSPLASLVAVGSALLVVYIVVDGIITSFESGTLELSRIIGLPLGGVIALMFASDAASLVADEARDPRLMKLRKEQITNSLQETVAKIPGKSRENPRLGLIMISIAVAIVTTAIGTGASWVLVKELVPTIAYLVMSLVIAVGLIPAATAMAPIALRGRTLEFVMSVVPLALVTLVLSMQSTFISIPFVKDALDPLAYIPSFVYGIIVPVPAIVTIIILLTIRFKEYSPPLIDDARKQLNNQIERITTHEPSDDEPEQWRAFAAFAIIFSALPVAGFALAATATWHRHSSTHRRGFRWIEFFAWACPTAAVILESLAVIYFPIYGPALERYIP